MSHLTPNTVESLGLGAPIGTTQTPHSASTRGMDDDEHGAGVGSGVAGGGTRAGNNADVYQASRGDGFSAGLSGEHTSGGLPSHGQTPIADKFTGHSTSAPGYDGASGTYAGSGTNNGLTGESHADSHFKNTSDLTGSRSGAGAGLAGAGLAVAGASGLHGAPSQEGVSGQYAGAGTSHGLTGESHAESHGRSNLAAGAGAAGLGVGALGAGAAAHSHSDRDATSRLDSQSGLGASGAHGASSAQSGFNSSSGNTGSHGLGASGVGAGAAAGVAGAGAYGASKTHDNANRNKHSEIDQPERGQPISNPEEIDSGTRHGLVWQESTGKYVHRHELEDEGKNAARRA